MGHQESITSLSRRAFLTTAAAAGGGLLLGVTFQHARAAAPTVTQVTAWVSIGTDNSVTILSGAPDMGTGILSGLPQVLAEELMVDWTQVATAEAPADPVYANPVIGLQAAFGSLSMMGFFQAMLVAGATARTMLIEAAATALGVPVSTCSAAHGIVSSTATSTTATYGSVAAAAAQLTPPSDPVLLSATRGYILVGQPVPRKDIPLKVNGSAIYGIDVKVPGMVYAGILHSPTLGGTLASLPATPAGAMSVVDLGNAVAVVAGDTFTAIDAAARLQANWTVPASSQLLDSTTIEAEALQLLESSTGTTVESDGDVHAALAAAPIRISAKYTLPYVPHACMEPLNCTASVTSTSCEIWAPTQVPGLVQIVAAAMTGLPASAITVNTTFMGGGLGRKLETDYVAQAIQISMAVGKPVKLTWAREEDFTNDQFRPTAISRVAAGIRPSGKVLGWRNRIVSPSPGFQRGQIGPNDSDSQVVVGAIGLSYAFGTREVQYVLDPAGIPVGYWRSVGDSVNAFAVESAIDELAHAAGLGPLRLRRKLLAGNTRALAVLNAAAALGNWTSPLEPGHARGIAYHERTNSLVAQVAEIAQMPGSPLVKVVRISCAVDCGLAVNPDSVEAQMQGGIVHGLNAALWGRQRFVKGVPQTRNFDHYPMLRLANVPKLAVTVLQTPSAPLGGIGEAAVPCIAPAIANAYFALTGIRRRKLPLGIVEAVSGEI